MANGRGTLVVISGPAGSGKGTVLGELMEMHPNYVFSVSATTRSPRPGEIDGKHYFFITRGEFERRVAEGDFLEHAEYVGNCYGTLRPFVEEMLSKGKNVLLDIEVNGAMQVREKFPEALLIFLTPPDYTTLAKRLRGRHTETEEIIEKRLAASLTELEKACEYDYLVVNCDGRARVAADEIDRMVTTRPAKDRERIKEFIKKFRK